MILSSRNWQGKNPEITQLREIVTENILYCLEDDDIQKATQSMGKQQVRRLVDLNKDKKLTGIVSLGDIARKSHDTKLCGKTLESISEKD